jgi:hypothetical protein
MAKRSKAKNGPRPLCVPRPWQCEPRGADCALLAFVEASGKWKTIALVKKTPGASAETAAAYIAGLVNDMHENGDVLQSALEALEAIVDEGLNFSTEQDADIVIRRLKNRYAAKGR